MIRSMTGFGAATAEQDGVRCTVELRSVNNRFFKSTLRLPPELDALEPELDALLMRRLTRGSITATVRWSESATRTVAHIDTAAMEAYLAQLRGALPAGISGELRLPDLLALPGVVRDDRS